MASSSLKTDTQAVQTTLSLLQDIFGSDQLPNFGVRLWDGTTWQSRPEAGEALRFTLVLQHTGALRSMLLPPSELNMGEAYIYNDYDVEGDFLGAFEIGDYLLDERWGKLAQARFGKRLLSLPKTGQPRPRDVAVKLHGTLHSKERDRQAVTYHYDRSNDFYALWLDRRMVYSCAYFDDVVTTLADAQIAKIDYILRKVRLQPGDTLLDIGCGWGALVVRAAQKFGARALGITLSREQHAEGMRRIAAAGVVDFSDKAAKKMDLHHFDDPKPSK